MANLSMRCGNCDASCYAHVSLMIPMGLRFRDFESGSRFGSLGIELVDNHGLDRFKTRTYTCYRRRAF